MLPAATHLDRFAPPDSGGAIEVEKIARAIARGLLNYKVPIEHDRLQAGQQVVRTIDVGPAHLRTANNRICEVVNQLAQEIRPRDKISIEDRDQISFRRLHALLESARLEAGAIVTMDVVDVETQGGVLLDSRAGDAHRFVG